METINKMITAFHIRATAAKSKTATAILDAAKSATDGKPELIADFIFMLAEAWRVKITDEIEQYRKDTTAAREQAEAEKQKAAQKAQAEGIIKTAGEYTAAIDTGNGEAASAALLDIKRSVSTLETDKTAKTIFPALADIYAEWDAYDPEKDFRPPLLAGASIKDGTLSYIGARTNIGKTTALINLTREALAAKRKVIFLTLEEPARDILRKLVLCKAYANAADPDRAMLRKLANEKGDLTADFHAARKSGFVRGNKEPAMLFKQLVLDAQKETADAYGSRLIFCEGRSIATLEATAAAVTKHAGPGDIVLVDFVQRLAGPQNRELNNYFLGKAQSNQLFQIAHDTGAAVIAGAQFKREKFEKEQYAQAPLGYKPFDDQSFREAGDIEQDGDYLFGIGESIDTAAAGRYIKILKVRSGSGRGRCYAIDLQGAYNYMGIGERLTKMNPVYSKSQRERSNKQILDWTEPDPDREPVAF